MFGPACGIGICALTALPGVHGAAVQHLAVAADRDLGRRAAHALVLDAIDDGLRLADDAEPRRGHQHDAAVALVRGVR